MNSEHINFMVKPGSSRDSVDGLYGKYIKVSINAPAEKGQANRKFIKFISRKLNIPKCSIVIVSGKKSTYKRVSIKCPSQINIKEKLVDNIP